MTQHMFDSCSGFGRLGQRQEGLSLKTTDVFFAHDRASIDVTTCDYHRNLTTGRDIVRAQVTLGRGLLKPSPSF